MATYTVGGKTYNYTPVSSTGYIDDYNNYADARNTTANAYREQLKTNLAGDEAKANSEYDSSARANYINYMQNKKNLPSALEAQGINGGASESALLKLYNNYGTNTATNESARGNALNTLRTTYDNNLATYNTNLENELASAYATALQNQRQYDQDRADAELDRFSQTVHRFNTYGEYTNWINQLQKSRDPYKDIKVAMVMQQRAIQFPNGNPASSGGGYSSGSGGSGGGSNGNFASTARSAVGALASAISGSVSAVRDANRIHYHTGR